MQAYCSSPCRLNRQGIVYLLFEERSFVSKRGTSRNLECGDPCSLGLWQINCGAYPLGPSFTPGYLTASFQLILHQQANTALEVISDTVALLCETQPAGQLHARTNKMDSFGVKRKDTTIGPPLRILSLGRRKPSRSISAFQTRY
jgi:hypothetical protein